MTTNHAKMLKIIFFLLLSYFTIIVKAQPQFTEYYPDTLLNKRLYTTIGTETASYLAGLSFLHFIWYKDHARVPFHFYNDSKGYLQIDKAGHAYGAYRESHSAYYALRWAGMNKKDALIYGGPIGLIFQTPIEIFDGLYEGWGFSWYDMIANTLGSILFVTQEALFNEQVFLMKFSYSPSIYPSYHTHLGVTQLERFFYDYNGHTYWISGNLQRITGSQKIPAWLNIAFGYSANGMIYEFENPTYYNGEPFPHLDRYRQFLLSLDINCSKIRTNNKFLQKILRSVDLIKIPFPAIELNRIEGIKFYPLYF